MQPSELFDFLKKQDFSEHLIEMSDAGIQPEIRIDPLYIEDLMYTLRDEESLKFESLSCLSGIDYGPEVGFGVVYHLNSMTKGLWVAVKVIVSYDNPHVPTIEHIFKAANWHEREAFDLYGIIFDDHPDLRRILLPDDWEGHPLRKDYQVQEYYHGVKVPF